MLAEAVPRSPERDECVRVRVRDGRAQLTGPQGSHELTSMLAADALAIVPRGEGDLPPAARSSSSGSSPGARGSRRRGSSAR